jgi:hypothetical protein
MKNVTISWVLPTTRQEGGPLPVDEIQHATIELSADGGANFSPIGQFAPDVLSTPVNDLPVSDQYVVRGWVTDTVGQNGNQVSVPFAIADDSPPGDLSIEVTLT